MSASTGLLVERPRLTPSRVIPRLRGNHRGSLWAGCVILGVMVIGAVFAPLIATQNPSTINPEASLDPPSTSHWFGADQFGRDIFARTLYAGRVDLLLAVSLVATGLLIGTAVGLIAGWRGGWLDTVVVRVIDVALAFPFLVLVLSVVGMRGPGLLSLYVAVSLVSWVFYARLVREEVQVARQSDYMKIARTSGFSGRRVVLRHLMPNVIVQPVVYAASDCTYALLIAASVSFLGAGVQPPTAEWGQMVSQGTQFLPSQWWISTFPAMAIAVTSIGFALVSEGLADLFRSGRAT